MRVLGLDPATKTGFGYGDKNGPFQSGAFKLPGLTDDLISHSLGAAYVSVFSLIKCNGIEAVVMEDSLFGITRKNKRGIATPSSYHTTKGLTMLQGVYRAAIFNAGVRHAWFPQPHEWRKQVLGAAYPENPKASAIRYCELVLKTAVINHDAAEGLAIMQFGHGQAKLL